LPAANPDFVNTTIIFSELEAGKKKKILTTMVKMKKDAKVDKLGQP